MCNKDINKEPKVMSIKQITQTLSIKLGRGSTCAIKNHKLKECSCVPRYRNTWLTQFNESYNKDLPKVSKKAEMDTFWPAQN